MLHVAKAFDHAAFPDPLDDDEIGDERVVVSRRRLIRLALVASEVGARFEREGVGHDPMAWLLSPRRVFGGGMAIDACLDLGDCTRALVLHGLGLELDATAGELDDLLRDDEDDRDEQAAAETGTRVLETVCPA